MSTIPICMRSTTPVIPVVWCYQSHLSHKRRAPRKGVLLLCPACHTTSTALVRPYRLKQSVRLTAIRIQTDMLKCARPICFHPHAKFFSSSSGPACLRVVHPVLWILLPHCHVGISKWLVHNIPAGTVPLLNRFFTTPDRFIAEPDWVVDVTDRVIISWTEPDRCSWTSSSPPWWCYILDFDWKQKHAKQLSRQNKNSCSVVTVTWLLCISLLGTFCQAIGLASDEVEAFTLAIWT